MLTRIGTEPGGELEQRRGRRVDLRLVGAAQHDRRARPLRAPEGIAADLERGKTRLNVAEPAAATSPSGASTVIARERTLGPPRRLGRRPSSIACMIWGTPGSTCTFSMRNPGATEIGLSISATPSGMSAIDMRAALTRSGG